MLTSSWKTNWSNWMTHNLITWGLQMYINKKLGQKRSLNSILIWTNSSRRMKHCEIWALFLFIIISKLKLNLSLLFIKFQIVPFRLVRSFGALNDNCDILLVSSFEVTNNDHLLPTSEPFKVVSYQHSISCIDTHSVGFPALCLLRQNRSIGRKVQTSEFNMVDETVALDAF